MWFYLLFSLFHSFPSQFLAYISKYVPFFFSFVYFLFLLVRVILFFIEHFFPPLMGYLRLSCRFHTIYFFEIFYCLCLLLLLLSLLSHFDISLIHLSTFASISLISIVIILSLAIFLLSPHYFDISLIHPDLPLLLYLLFHHLFLSEFVQKIYHFLLSTSAYIDLISIVIILLLSIFLL